MILDGGGGRVIAMKPALRTLAGLIATLATSPPRSTWAPTRTGARRRLWLPTVAVVGAAIALAASAAANPSPAQGRRVPLAIPRG
jgi:hypothetical protein